MLVEIPELSVFEDTCQVYCLRCGDQAVLVDFGSGAALEVLKNEGARVTDVLVTHFHRDQVQGLEKAIDAGARIWVPYSEQTLFSAVDWHWQGRNIFNNYDVRQDRFTLLHSVEVAGLLEDYQRYTFSGFTFTVLPTPGHTAGSISLLAEVGEKRLAFTGDLIYEAGKVWSLAAMQWSYVGSEGLPAAAASLVDLKGRGVDVLLPSHGEVITNPVEAIDLLVERLAGLMHSRNQNPRLFKFIEHPYERISTHLLRSQQNMANTFVLLSESGKALLIDYGYDLMTGMPEFTQQYGRRPWLYSIPTLKRQFGIQKIEAVIPTHYHDDHVAGINLLRQVEGAQVWAAENFAEILEAPERYDLPCLWYDPIPVERKLALNQPFQWEEYTLTVYGLPGHTLYAAAIGFEVDGVRVLATGDQYAGNSGMEWNYVYQNRFRSEDFRLTAELYAQLRPELILSGHWEPLWVRDEQFWDHLMQRGRELEQMHLDLLPEEIRGFGAEGFGARLQPYQVAVKSGTVIDYEVELVNPHNSPAEVEVRLEVPAGWEATPEVVRAQFEALERRRINFFVHTPEGTIVRRERIAAELRVKGQSFGLQAEALVTLHL